MVTNLVTNFGNHTKYLPFYNLISMYTALDIERKFSFLRVTNILTRNQCALFQNILFMRT